MFEFKVSKKKEKNEMKADGQGMHLARSLFWIVDNAADGCLSKF